MLLQEDTLRRIETYIHSRREDMIAALCRLIEIPSVSCPQDNPDAPYGESCKKALEVMTTICRERGLSLQNHENRCASLKWGESDEEIGVFTHLDVVPGGGGWSGDAFTPVVENGFVRGRGAIDNKGSAVIGLFALDCIRSLKLPMRHSVRLFYGCNEEDMMTDCEYYGTIQKWPKFTLVPDNEFPAAYAEKGILAGVLRSAAPADKILSLKAGTATNTVAGECEILLDKSLFEQLKPFESDRVSVTLSGGFTRLFAEGLSAHASMPEQSLNAIGLAFDALLCSDTLEGEEKRIVAFWRDTLLDVSGKSLGIDLDANEYGRLTIIGGLAKLDGERRFEFGFNCRYPATDCCSRLVPILEKACRENGMTLTVQEGVDGFHLSPEHPVVCAMTSLYNELSGENRSSVLMKGATYCRVIPNAIPFGPERDKTAPAFPKGRGGIHQPDESFNIEEMLFAAKTYAAALLTLDNIL